MKNLQENEDDELHIGREIIASIVGQNRANEVFDKVLQLVLADCAYFDGNPLLYFVYLYAIYYSFYLFLFFIDFRILMSFE